MRNAFVVLVPICIGLVSGLIVPSSVPELTTKRSISNTERSTHMELKSSTLAVKLAILPKSRNDIDEKDLYEHATERQNNQSERAFIYINQKYRKPVRNKIIKISSHDKPGVDHTNVTPTPTLSVPQTPCPSAFDSGHSAKSLKSVIPAHPAISAHSAKTAIAAHSGVTANLPNSYFQGYDFSDKPQEMSSYFVAPNIFRCNFYDKNKQFKDTVKTQVQPKHRADERRDYFELLKPPILRPVNRANNNANYNGNRPNEFPALSPSGIPHKDNYINKKYNVKNQYPNKAKTADERKDEMRQKFGYDRPSIHHPVFRNKEILHRADDGTFSSDFMSDDEGRRLYEGNQEEDKLLTKYLKDTLEEQAGTNDKGTGNDCSYRDCILQSSKQYTSNGLVIKPECKCGRRLNIKHADPFIAKDRSLRQETKQKETATKSAEVNYEELLTDDSNTIKLDDDVVRPPSKTNETSVH